MSEQLTIRCDRCSNRVAKAARSRIRFGHVPHRRDPYDVCSACRHDLERWLGIAAPPEAEGPADKPAA